MMHKLENVVGEVNIHGYMEHVFSSNSIVMISFLVHIFIPNIRPTRMFGKFNIFNITFSMW